MSIKNSPKKLAVLSLLAILGLTACNNSSDEIYSKPSDYEGNIVTIVDGEGNEQDIHNNILKLIYDAIHKGSLAEEVLDNALYRYAQSIFGVYNGVVDKGRTQTSLKEAWEAYDRIEKHQETATDQETLYGFVRAHKSYWKYDANGKHVDANGEEVADDKTFTPCQTELDHVASKWAAIENRIAESIYARAVSGTYVEKNFFREIKYLRSLHESGKKVNYSAAKADASIVPVIVPYTVEKADIFNNYGTVDAPKYYIHRAYLQDSINVDDNDYSNCKATYVEDEIIPSVYKDLLIEQYLLDEDEAAIRNSRARKINVLKIEKYSKFTNNADMLVKKLLKEIYAAAPASTQEYVETDSETIEEAGKKLFEKYSKIAKGMYDDIQSDPDALAIVDELNANASDVYEKATSAEGFSYYKKTSYGDVVEEYSKLCTSIASNDWDDLDESLYSDYTSSGKTTVREGFDQKRIELSQKQNITKGWYIQNNSPSLDSAGKINERLFKLSVANAKVEIGEEGECDAQVRATNLSTLAAADRWVKTNSGWALREEPSETENKFLCSINGTNYLKFEGQYAEDDWKNDIVYDDGNAYYIVQVFEAAKDIKLKEQAATSNYVASRGQAFFDEVIDEVAKTLGETGNYASVSKEYWLKKMDIKYHDQVVYDYLKENYPNLFK